MLWNSRRLFIACIFVLLAGCNRGPRQARIAVVPKATSHLFWQTVHAGVVAAGRDLNVEILWNSPAVETDFSRQIQIVDSMLVQKVDGLALSASDRTALNASLDRAAQLGIPVTVFDSGVDSDKYMTFIATNNYEAGQMGARKLAELLDGKGKIAMVLHMPGSYSTMERERGFEETIRKESPAIEIVARQYGMSDRSKSMAAAENMLTAHPDLQGMFCSTEPSSTGTSLALKERNLAGKVKFVAFDSADNMIEDMRAGVIHAMVVQDPFKMGYEAVKTLVDKLHGSAPAEKVDLSARVVTKEDLEKPDVHALLFPDLKKYLN